MNHRVARGALHHTPAKAKNHYHHRPESAKIISEITQPPWFVVTDSTQRPDYAALRQEVLAEGTTVLARLDKGTKLYEMAEKGYHGVAKELVNMPKVLQLEQYKNHEIGLTAGSNILLDRIVGTLKRLGVGDMPALDKVRQTMRDRFEYLSEQRQQKAEAWSKEQRSHVEALLEKPTKDWKISH